MTISEKVLNKIPITEEEFRELVKKTDWEDYKERVVKRIGIAVDNWEKSVNKTRNNRYFSFSNLP